MTTTSRRLLLALIFLTGAVIAPGAATAAQSYDSCTDFIDSLPATITTQGVWCLRKNLSTAITSGYAIIINANNVTIDCNGFKIGGLAAGIDSKTVGIFTHDRQNAIIRHCNVRGFNTGIYLFNGAGHLIEDNRLDNNLYMGIRISGDNNVVRRNLVYDTGGASGSSGSFGIHASADVIDNTVNGVFSTATVTQTYGIRAVGTGGVVRDNRVRGLQVSAGGGTAIGITVPSQNTKVDGNMVVAPAGTTGKGIEGEGMAVPPYTTSCSNNVVAGFTTPLSKCILNNNVIL